jgi:hypothetical protein
MQQQKEWPADLHACKDKFLVQSLVLDLNQVASVGASSSPPPPPLQTISRTHLCPLTCKARLT